MTFKKIQLYYNTVKHLRRKQIAYRLWYFLRNRCRRMAGFRYHFAENTPLSIKLQLDPSIPAFSSFLGEKSFVFLNLTKKFDNEIDWEFADYGKLWTYNLTYFDFLNQKESDNHNTQLVKIIEDFINKQPTLKNANEPFPISLRGINWIKFFYRNNIQNPIYDRSLFHQYQILADNIEYHLLGNHLLENGFSMLFGAVYFQNESFFKTAHAILTAELEEQILADGAHFELSPMYHKIMLFRILDCFNLLINNDITLSKETQEKVVCLTELLFEKATLMLGWLKNMTYSDNSTPHFGDSTDGIAPSANELFEYAQTMHIYAESPPLSISGFRKLKNAHFELIAKVGQIGPDYIPGHAHADSLSFELRVKGNPILIDMGISTYETNERRLLERSTSSHNTVEVNGQNSSEVWSSFRVANRAKTTILKDTPSELKAAHDGYKNWGIQHERQFILTDNCIEINDKTGVDVVSKAFWHFPPHMRLTIENDCIRFNEGFIEFLINKKDNSILENIELVDYFCPTQYNTFLKAQKAVVTFNHLLQTFITIT